MIWMDGTVYEGQWKKGVQSGQGRLKMSDGTLKVGMFKNNILIEEESSDMPKETLTILGSSDSSRKLTELHEALLGADYDKLMKFYF